MFPNTLLSFMLSQMVPQGKRYKLEENSIKWEDIIRETYLKTRNGSTSPLEWEGDEGNEARGLSSH